MSVSPVSSVKATKVDLEAIKRSVVVDRAEKLVKEVKKVGLKETTCNALIEAVNKADLNGVKAEDVKSLVDYAYHLFYVTKPTLHAFKFAVDFLVNRINKAQGDVLAAFTADESKGVKTAVQKNLGEAFKALIPELKEDKPLENPPLLADPKIVQAKIYDFPAVKNAAIDYLQDLVFKNLDKADRDAAKLASKDLFAAAYAEAFKVDVPAAHRVKLALAFVKGELYTDGGINLASEVDRANALKDVVVKCLIDTVGKTTSKAVAEKVAEDIHKVSRRAIALTYINDGKVEAAIKALKDLVQDQVTAHLISGTTDIVQGAFKVYEGVVDHLKTHIKGFKDIEGNVSSDSKDKEKATKKIAVYQPMLDELNSYKNIIETASKASTDDNAKLAKAVTAYSDSPKDSLKAGYRAFFDVELTKALYAVARFEVFLSTDVDTRQEFDLAKALGSLNDKDLTSFTEVLTSEALGSKFQLAQLRVLRPVVAVAGELITSDAKEPSVDASKVPHFEDLKLLVKANIDEQVSSDTFFDSVIGALSQVEMAKTVSSTSSDPKASPSSVAASLSLSSFDSKESKESDPSVILESVAWTAFDTKGTFSKFVSNLILDLGFNKAFTGLTQCCAKETLDSNLCKTYFEAEKNKQIEVLKTREAAVQAAITAKTEPPKLPEKAEDVSTQIIKSVTQQLRQAHILTALKGLPGFPEIFKAPVEAYIKSGDTVALPFIDGFVTNLVASAVKSDSLSIKHKAVQKLLFELQLQAKLIETTLLVDSKENPKTTSDFISKDVPLTPENYDPFMLQLSADLRKLIVPFFEAAKPESRDRDVLLPDTTALADALKNADALIAKFVLKEDVKTKCSMKDSEAALAVEAHFYVRPLVLATSVSLTSGGLPLVLESKRPTLALADQLKGFVAEIEPISKEAHLFNITKRVVQMVLVDCLEFPASNTKKTEVCKAFIEANLISMIPNQPCTLDELAKVVFEALLKDNNSLKEVQTHLKLKAEQFAKTVTVNGQAIQNKEMTLFLVGAEKLVLAYGAKAITGVLKAYAQNSYNTSLDEQSQSKVEAEKQLVNKIKEEAKKAKTPFYFDSDKAKLIAACGNSEVMPYLLGRLQNEPSKDIVLLLAEDAVQKLISGSKQTSLYVPTAETKFNVLAEESKAPKPTLATYAQAISARLGVDVKESQLAQIPFGASPDDLTDYKDRVTKQGDLEAFYAEGLLKSPEGRDILVKFIGDFLSKLGKTELDVSWKDAFSKVEKDPKVLQALFYWYISSSLVSLTLPQFLASDSVRNWIFQNVQTMNATDRLALVLSNDMHGLCTQDLLIEVKFDGQLKNTSLQGFAEFLGKVETQATVRTAFDTSIRTQIAIDPPAGFETAMNAKLEALVTECIEAAKAGSTVKQVIDAKREQYNKKVAVNLLLDNVLRSSTPITLVGGEKTDLGIDYISWPAKDTKTCLNEYLTAAKALPALRNAFEVSIQAAVDNLHVTVGLDAYWNAKKEDIITTAINAVIAGTANVKTFVEETLFPIDFEKAIRDQNAKVFEFMKTLVSHTVPLTVDAKDVGNKFFDGQVASELKLAAKAYIVAIGNGAKKDDFTAEVKKAVVEAIDRYKAVVVGVGGETFENYSAGKVDTWVTEWKNLLANNLVSVDQFVQNMAKDAQLKSGNAILKTILGADSKLQNHEKFMVAQDKTPAQLVTSFLTSNKNEADVLSEFETSVKRAVDAIKNTNPGLEAYFIANKGNIVKATIDAITAGKGSVEAYVTDVVLVAQKAAVTDSRDEAQAHLTALLGTDVKMVEDTKVVGVAFHEDLAATSKSKEEYVETYMALIATKGDDHFKTPVVDRFKVVAKADPFKDVEIDALGTKFETTVDAQADTWYTEWVALKGEKLVPVSKFIENKVHALRNLVVKDRLTEILGAESKLATEAKAAENFFNDKLATKPQELVIPFLTAATIADEKVKIEFEASVKLAVDALKDTNPGFEAYCVANKEDIVKNSFKAVVIDNSKATVSAFVTDVVLVEFNTAVTTKRGEIQIHLNTLLGEEVKLVDDVKVVGETFYADLTTAKTAKEASVTAYMVKINSDVKFDQHFKTPVTAIIAKQAKLHDVNIDSTGTKFATTVDAKAGEWYAEWVALKGTQTVAAFVKAKADAVAYKAPAPTSEVKFSAPVYGHKKNKDEEARAEALTDLTKFSALKDDEKEKSLTEYVTDYGIYGLGGELKKILGKAKTTSGTLKANELKLELYKLIEAKPNDIKTKIGAVAKVVKGHLKNDGTRERFEANCGKNDVLGELLKAVSAFRNPEHLFTLPVIDCLSVATDKFKLDDLIAALKK